MMTLRASPVTSSNSSRTVALVVASPRLAASCASRSSTMSTYCTLPVNSVRMGVVCGSHSTRTAPAFTRGAGWSGSTLTLTLAP